MNEMKTNEQRVKFRQQAWAAFTLSVLLGFGWAFGLAASESLPTIAYYTVSCVFIFSATLQGLLLFLLQVVRNPDARKPWRNMLGKVIPPATTTSSTSAGNQPFYKADAPSNGKVAVVETTESHDRN